MFTGIVQNIGKIYGIEHTKGNYQLIVENKFSSLKKGESVAIDGICLTVTNFSKDEFSVDVMPETYSRSNIRDFKVGSLVNLELAMQVKKRFDGHFVLGHVDTTSQLLAKKADRNSTLLTFSIDEKYQPYLVEKGSVALDGVSLTIIDVKEDKFSVGIIPYTHEKTVLGSLQINQTVNLETDILAKYILNQVAKENSHA
ncbi:riboflavin synthase [Companilactobacillus halodurans]|uniref:Riboflavin synthase n=1 Tax=Companilactobacillus halodurans TaxID=2584183 RepID=A0A5P0ZM19_9LACO|nr:riboflavin synthase [Companilactobacillus halodurans]MQS74861.1 riboflavin synthase [Companilactobacillus halodurans]MQS97256.1 riboflavin synthase [Companilactobacillus halodurans]